MPRALRIQDAGYLHHITCRGNNKRILFAQQKDFSTYVDLLNHAKKVFPLKIYNYCLMDNHIHLLVEPMEDGALSKVMEYVTKAYAKYFNREYTHTGHVFEGRFKSFLIEEKGYYFACSRYIDLNPIKAQMVKEPQDYKWSGYAQMALGKKGVLKVDLHELYEELGKNANERQIVYKALVLTGQAEDLDLLNSRAGILGSREFKKLMREKAKR